MLREPVIPVMTGQYEPPRRSLLRRLVPIELSPIDPGHFANRVGGGRQVMVYVDGWLARLIWFVAQLRERRRIRRGVETGRRWTFEGVHYVTIKKADLLALRDALDRREREADTSVGLIKFPAASVSRALDLHAEPGTQPGDLGSVPVSAGLPAKLRVFNGE